MKVLHSNNVDRDGIDIVYPIHLLMFRKTTRDVETVLFSTQNSNVSLKVAGKQIV